MATTATSVEWARQINTTTRKFIKGEEIAVLRERILLDKIQKLGNIQYDVSGDGVQWQVRKSRGNVQVNNGAQSITFPQTNRHIKAFLDYQGLVIAEAMYEREKLKNRGAEALVDVWGGLAKTLSDDLKDAFGEELYVDDSATGNSGRISGFEAMFAATQTVSEATTTSVSARTANAADRVYYPNDTYAGISTVLGNEGGSWGSNWPQGKGDAEFDYFSPLIVNGGSSAFDGASTTWTLNCRRALQFGAIYSRKNVSSKGQIDLGIFDRPLYDKLRTTTHSAERIMITQNSAATQELGISSNSFGIEGIECTWEYGTPANVGYGINTKCVSLLSMYPDLFEVKGPYEDEDANAWKMAVKFMGQLKFDSPRNFVKWQLGTGTL